MRTLFIFFCAVVLAMALCGTEGAHALELMTNGGFETGDLTGWSHYGDTSYSGVDGAKPHTGRYGFYAGPTSDMAFLDQSLQTVAGQEYTLSFWMSRDPQGSPFEEPFNWFTALWDGVPVLDRGNFFEQDYTLYSFTVQAASTGSLLTFGLFDSQSFINLDDVSVTGPDVPPSAVPEPGTIVLLGAGLGGIIVARRISRA
ncbi:MAG: carbohydrate binding domain-containing protein [Nitrospirota bacterium]